MANELAVEIKVTYTPSAANQESVQPNKITQTITMTGSDFVTGTQEIGTSDESLDVGSVATLGWMMVKNLDSTNFVEYKGWME